MVAAANIATLTAIPGVLSGYRKQEMPPNEASRALDDDEGAPLELPIKASSSLDPHCETSCQRIPSGPTSVSRRSTNIATGALAVLVLGHLARGTARSMAPLLGAFWLAVFIYMAAPPAVSKSASYRQLPLATMLRLLQPAVMLLSDQQSTHSGLLAFWPEPSSPPFWAFLLHSLVASKTFLLALAALSGGRMPFGRHLALQGAALAAAAYGSYGACGKVCAAHGRALGHHLQALLRVYHLTTAPAFAATGMSSTAGELLPLPATPRFQCWLAWCFQALLFGSILPSLLLLWLRTHQQAPAPAPARPGRSPATPQAFFRGDSARREEGVPASPPRPAGARDVPAAPAVLGGASMTNRVVVLLLGLAFMWCALVMGANVAEGLASEGLVE